MKRPLQVLVYVTPEQKEVVREVCFRLNLKESALFKALALPGVEKLLSSLKNGADPATLREHVLRRIHAG